MVYVKYSVRYCDFLCFVNFRDENMEDKILEGLEDLGLASD